MTEFKVGTRVRVLRDTFLAGLEGVVVGVGNYPHYIFVNVDNYPSDAVAFSPLDLELIEEPTEPAKPECYVTAWYHDGGCTLTGDGAFSSRAAADAWAVELARDHSDTVVVFKMVSKHSAAVTVTSEDV